MEWLRGLSRRKSFGYFSLLAAEVLFISLQALGILPLFWGLLLEVGDAIGLFLAILDQAETEQRLTDLEKAVGRVPKWRRKH